MKDTKKKKVPDFKSQEDERKFWATADSTEYIDWSSAKRAKLVHLSPCSFLAERLADERSPRKQRPK